jgi:hypothetical protein
MARLRLPGPAPFQGGSLDLELDGAWDLGRIGFVDLPLKVVLTNTRLVWKGIEPQDLERLELAIGLSGAIDAPRIRFDASALTDALVAAGKKQLADRLRGELDGRLGGKLEELKDKAGIELPTELPKELPGELPKKEEVQDALKGLFPKKKPGS